MLVSYCIAVLALAQSSQAAVLSLRGQEAVGTTVHVIVNLPSAREDPDARNFSKADIDLKRDALKTYDKAKTMRPDKMLDEDMRLAASHLLPGKPPDYKKRGLELFLAFLSVAWFILYEKTIYVNDQKQEIVRLEKRVREASEAREAEDEDEEKETANTTVEHVEQALDACDRCWRASIAESTEEVEAPEPDLVIVCHNPVCPKYTDSATTPPKGTLQSTLGFNTIELFKQKDTPQGDEKPDELMAILPRVAGLLNIHSRTAAQKAYHAMKDFTGGYLTSADENEPEDDMAAASSEQLATKTYATIRAAIIQDLYELLPKKGFSVTIFNSVDKDELFLCVSLNKEYAMRRYLTMQGIKLQVQRSVVEAMKVKHNPKDIESSPPYMKYDPQLASYILGENKTDMDFYQQFAAPSGGKVIMHSTERSRAILKDINGILGLDQAKQAGLIVGWFPAHTRDGIVRLEKHWSTWGKLCDLTFTQPTNLLQKYFGSRFAFLFAWNGCYCKMLLALVPVALAFHAANAAAMVAGENPYWNRRSLFGFGLVVAIWTRLAANAWRREETYLVHEWDLKDVIKDLTIRPDFFGEKRQSEIDENLLETHYPTLKYKARQAVAWVVTALFCCLDFCVVIMWIDAWHGRMNIVANIILALLIQVFTLIYNTMVEVLTNFENHKYQLTYYNSYLMKMFFFQCVNQYSAFFYIAVKQQFTDEGCPRIDVYDNDCVGLLAENLPGTLLVLTVARVVQVVLATLKVKFNLWYEDYQMKQNGLEVTPRSFLEEQAKFGQFRVREQIEASVQLVLALGFVLIFGTVSPSIAVLALIVFMVQLRAGAVLVTTAAARTVPRKAAGVGPLKDCVDVLTYVGVIFTGYLIVCFGPLFDGCLILTRLTGFLLWGLAISLIWMIIDAFTRNDTKSADKLAARRAHVSHKIAEQRGKWMYKLSTGECTPHSDASPRHISVGETGDAEYAKEVADANWDAIPSLWELHQRKKQSVAGKSEKP